MIHVYLGVLRDIFVRITPVVGSTLHIWCESLLFRRFGMVFLSSNSTRMVWFRVRQTAREICITDMQTGTCMFVNVNYNII